MSIFDDKRYDNLDWISQATEPMEGRLTELLARMPERVDLTYEQVSRLLTDSFRLHVARRDFMIELLLEATKDMPGDSGSLNYEETGVMNDCFMFEVQENTIVDMVNKTMTGGVAIVKTQFTFSDNTLKDAFGAKGLNYIRSSLRFGYNIDRGNKMAEIIGDVGKEYFSARSANKKYKFLYARIKTILEKNEWNIKNIDLADKMCVWISDYISEGNLAALANICKLKVMTHKGVGIYSVEEQQ